MRLLVVAVMAVIVVIGVAVFLRGKKKIPPTPKSADDVYMGLRSQALNGFRNTNVPDNEPIAILMDMGVTNGTATVVAYKDGTASIYLSSGGGYIGGGQSHEQIRDAGEHMLWIAAENKAAMHETSEYPLPTSTETKFYLVTGSKVFTTTAPTNDLGNKKHELWPLFYAGQEIITQYRTLPQTAR